MRNLLLLFSHDEATCGELRAQKRHSCLHIAVRRRSRLIVGYAWAQGGTKTRPTVLHCNDGLAVDKERFFVKTSFVGQ